MQRKNGGGENQGDEKTQMEDTRVSQRMICVHLVLPKVREIHRFCTNQYCVSINIHQDLSDNTKVIQGRRGSEAQRLFLSLSTSGNFLRTCLSRRETPHNTTINMLLRQLLFLGRSEHAVPSLAHTHRSTTPSSSRETNDE